MAHKRIRPFNTKDTYPEQNLDNDLAHAVVARGDNGFPCARQCPQELDDGVNIDSHDPVDQTHKVMQNIEQLLTESGAKMEHLVKLVIYITDVRHRESDLSHHGSLPEGCSSRFNRSCGLRTCPTGMAR